MISKNRSMLREPQQIFVLALSSPKDVKIGISGKVFKINVNNCRIW